ncbi:alpha/beta hydrolase [Winogradskya consettensis]|uniref:Hydrolase n=2 Tax=Winogradskya consettensis TaxID=113560 RepID=A0A919T5A9_9ACTN|nr:hydrolase [Actinoplanes consettensis]
MTVAALTGIALTGCEAADDEDKPVAFESSASAPALVWGACPTPGDARQTCTTVQVPLNYQDPGSATIAIAVSKLSTAKAGEHRDALVLNPGGPALPGLGTPSAVAPTLPASVLAEYDLIGFDPRGVEHSNPQSCGLGELPVYGLFPFPAADGSITANVEAAKSIAQKCSAVPDLKYYNTASTARDLDWIRQALGVEKLAYWGQSYGTYLGVAYDMLFPDRTGKLILEGNVDPAKAWAGEVGSWGKGMAERFPDAAAVAAKQSGRTVEQVTDSYLALADRLDRTPAPIPGTQAALDGSLLRNLTYALLLHNETLPMVPQLWTAAADLADGKLTDADKALIAQALTQPPATPGVPADNQASMFVALMCGDVAWPAGADGYQAAVAADREAWPLTAGMPANVWPCAFWPNQPIDGPITVSATGARNVLILQNRRDNATPWDSAAGLHAEFGGRSALVGVDNGGHYVYHAGSACADQATVTFLSGGTLPGGDVDCTDAE